MWRRKNNRTERKRPSLALEICEFLPKSCLDQLKAWNLSEVCFSRDPKTFIQCCQGRIQHPVVIKIFGIVFFEAVPRKLHDVSNNWSECADVSGFRLSYFLFATQSYFQLVTHILKAEVIVDLQFSSYELIKITLTAQKQNFNISPSY